MKSRCAPTAELTKSSNAVLREAREIARRARKVPAAKTAAPLPGKRHTDDASILWHELLSPVTLIKAYTSTMLQLSDALTKEDHIQYIKGIDRASDKLVRLLEDLRDVTKLENLEIYREQSVSLPALVKQVLSEMQSQTSKHTLKLNFKPPLPHIRVDAEKMDQVMTNLISNAIKYSPNGGDILVDVRFTRAAHDCEGRCHNAPLLKFPCYIISVTDSGMGIPEDELGHIFDKFYRVNDKTVRSIPGTGLGLYICKIIVEAHGGRIWAANRPGGGSVFSFTLPLDLETPAAR